MKKVLLFCSLFAGAFNAANGGLGRFPEQSIHSLDTDTVFHNTRDINPNNNYYPDPETIIEDIELYFSKPLRQQIKKEYTKCFLDCIIAVIAILLYNYLGKIITID